MIYEIRLDKPAACDIPHMWDFSPNFRWFCLKALNDVSNFRLIRFEIPQNNRTRIRCEDKSGPMNSNSFNCFKSQTFSFSSKNPKKINKTDLFQKMQWPELTETNCRIVEELRNLHLIELFLLQFNFYS